MARLNGSIPREIGGGVGIAARYSCIPAIGDFGSVAVSPAKVPPIYCRGFRIGDTYGTCVAVVPFAADNLLAGFPAAITGNNAAAGAAAGR